MGVVKNNNMNATTGALLTILASNTLFIAGINGKIVEKKKTGIAKPMSGVVVDDSRKRKKKSIRVNAIRMLRGSLSNIPKHQRKLFFHLSMPLSCSMSWLLLRL